MTRYSIRSILAAAVLLLAPGFALRAQDPKPAPAPRKGSKPADKKGGKKAAKPQPNYNLGEAPEPIKPSAKSAAKPVHPKGRSRRSSSKLPVSQRIDINSATKEELMKLPGIFAAEADKIIAHRPYGTKTGLLEFAGLTGAQYFGIKDLVRTGGGSPQPPK
ncbi:MAG: helix-hairpin-helix domain-containing protein [Acidobacteria bacterium]|nr:helix-hairpin-helix domain-containing protein [Acidobacteriota bacterium]MBI3490033.1 helix-hairpin-helix domain-containing protein [Acidobacteriota bacterium]